MPSIETRVQQCFMTVFPDFTSEKVEDAVLDNTPLWDSMATVMLITVIEEEFVLTIDPMDFEKLISYKAIVNYIRQNFAVAAMAE